MKATQLLHNMGQSLWLDNITRDLLDRGTLEHYIRDLSVTGLTSNPTIFDHAIKNSASYDASIREKLARGKSGEALFFELALEDLTRAAALFQPLHNQSNGVDGWVSLEVSPLLAYDDHLAPLEGHFARRMGTSPCAHARRGPRTPALRGQRERTGRPQDCLTVTSWTVSASRRSSTRIVSSIGVSSRTCETTECSARSAEDAVEPQFER